jgi:hypothetical protein
MLHAVRAALVFLLLSFLIAAFFFSHLFCFSLVLFHGSFVLLDRCGPGFSPAEHRFSPALFLP